jgi:hypothetical protein
MTDKKLWRRMDEIKSRIRQIRAKNTRLFYDLSYNRIGRIRLEAINTLLALANEHSQELVEEAKELTEGE